MLPAEMTQEDVECSGDEYSSWSSDDVTVVGHGFTEPHAFLSSTVAIPSGWSSSTLRRVLPFQSKTFQRFFRSLS